ncbi:MAG: hypothetical protein AAF959_27930, partial [Cyanobacteria bacterium P01_D01_bin.56]
ITFTATLAFGTMILESSASTVLNNSRFMKFFSPRMNVTGTCKTALPMLPYHDKDFWADFPAFE